MSPNRASSTIRPFDQVPNASRNGALEVPPSAFIRAKVGDSLSWSLIHSEMPSSRIETRNGIRQPQSANAASPRAVRVSRMTIRDRKRPPVAVVWIQDV